MTACSVTAISWARVHLTLTVLLEAAAGQHEQVVFELVDKGRHFPVETTWLGSDFFELHINITNFRSRRQVPDGSWRLVPFVDGEQVGPAAGYELSQMEQLDQDSRTFVYAKNMVSFIVNFGVTEDDVRPDFLIRTYQMFRSSRARKPKPSVRGFVARKVLPRARRVKLANRWYDLARTVSRPDGTRVLFASEMRRSMEGNLLRVHDRMVERGLDSRFSFRYSFRMPYTATKRSTLRVIWLLATSDVVLIDDYFGMLQSLKLSPSTKIIQAWHAGSGFKSIGYSRFGKYGSPKLQNAHRKYTYVLTGSEHLVPVYAEAFGIEEDAVIPTGLPRIDTFLDPARTEQVVADFYAEHPQLRDKKILLFAPTFRGRTSTSAYYDYSRIDFDQLYEMCGEDAVVLFRMHHFVRDPVPIPPEYADRLLDFASFPSSNDLLHVTDILITDYSSIIYEFSLLNRPMVFFAYDKEIYAATRGFHRDFEVTAPGKVCTTTEALVRAVQEEDFDLWKIEAFRRENFDRVDTGSADRVIDWLILDDPRTSRAASSQPAREEPTAGDANVAAAELVDQDEA